MVSDDIELLLLEVSDAREEIDSVGNEEDVALSDCKELLVAVVTDDIELVPLEVSVA